MSLIDILGMRNRQLGVKDYLALEEAKLKDNYEDILIERKDLSQDYQTREPECLQFLETNPIFSIDDLAIEHKNEFREQFLQKKKQLELEIIKDNRRQEVIDKIVDIIKVGNNREVQKKNYERV